MEENGEEDRYVFIAGLHMLISIWLPIYMGRVGFSCFQNNDP